MKVVDANVLLNVVRQESEWHADARRWMDAALSGGAIVGFDWMVLNAFIRVSTHPRLFQNPLDLAQACAAVDQWVGAPSARIVHPGAGHLNRMQNLLDAVGSTGGNLVNDAHVAALAVEHRATVVSFDSDFGRFPGVRWEQPR